MTHLLQNAAYYGSFTEAVKTLVGSAAARMSLSIGQKLSPGYYKEISEGMQSYGNPPRVQIFRSHMEAFFIFF